MLLSDKQKRRGVVVPWWFKFVERQPHLSGGSDEYAFIGWNLVIRFKRGLEFHFLKAVFLFISRASNFKDSYSAGYWAGYDNALEEVQRRQSL